MANASSKSMAGATPAIASDNAARSLALVWASKATPRKIKAPRLRARGLKCAIRNRFALHQSRSPPDKEREKAKKRDRATGYGHGARFVPRPRGGVKRHG